MMIVSRLLRASQVTPAQSYTQLVSTYFCDVKQALVEVNQVLYACTLTQNWVVGGIQSNTDTDRY